MARIPVFISLDEVRALAIGCSYRAKLVARRLGISLSQLERRFHHEHWLAPQKFLNILRLEAAAAMLEKERVLKVVAIEMKYSRSHLSRAFTYHFGLSSTAYIARFDRR